ncbi:hypothetical protein ACCS55_15920 [Rhizobium ruizarguesonis]
MTMREDLHEASEESVVEAELKAALQRLKERAVKGQAARISYSAVAREAKRSRTLIGHDGCAYPEVRKAVTEAIELQSRLDKPGRRLRSSVNAGGQPAGERGADVGIESADPLRLVVHLKARVVELLNQNKVAAIKIVTIDDENQQLRNEVTRLKTELARRRASNRS